MGMAKLPVSYEELTKYSTEEIKEMLLGKHFKYMEEHGYRLSGDIMGIVITKAMEQKKEMQYLLISAPIEEL
jgi:effector-binding domain-containing protein